MELGQFFLTHYVFANLGVGGMSRVFLGFDCKTYQFVALKTLLERFQDDESVVARMRREAEIYQRLVHKNIVGFVEAGEGDGKFFIVQEYLRGDPLSDLLTTFQSGLPFQAALQILTDLAEALHIAHESGVIHRDVQPDNIMIDHEGEARLFDFGIAWAEDKHINTAIGTIMGTVLYSSPEQNQGEAVDERTDLYSLGAILFEMLTGERFNPAETLDAAVAFQYEEVRDLRAINPEIPEALERITRKLLHPEPDSRYHSTTELLIDIGRLKLELSFEDVNQLYGHPFFRTLRDARHAVGDDEFTKAIGICESLLEEYSEYKVHDISKVHYALGKAQAAIGRHDASVRSFERALFSGPGNVDYALDFAIELIKVERVPKAKAILEQLIERDIENVLARGLLELIERDGGVPDFSAANKRGSSWFGGLFTRFRSKR